MNILGNAYKKILLLLSFLIPLGCANGKEYHLEDIKIVRIGVNKSALAIDLTAAKIPTTVKLPHMTVGYWKSGFTYSNYIGLRQFTTDWLKKRKSKVSFRLCSYGPHSCRIQGDLEDLGKELLIFLKEKRNTRPLHVELKNNRLCRQKCKN